MAKRHSPSEPAPDNLVLHVRASDGSEVTFTYDEAPTVLKETAPSMQEN